MPVETKSVTTRREVRYESFDDLLADAERLVSGGAHMQGNWSLGQIFAHLATAFNSSIDGFSFRAPWYIRFVARWFMKGRFLNKGLPAGYQIPDKHKKDFVADEGIDTVEAFDSLKRAVERQRVESKRVPHPVLGKLNLDEWERFHLRHAELHMSFAVPEDQ